MSKTYFTVIRKGEDDTAVYFNCIIRNNDCFHCWLGFTSYKMEEDFIKKFFLFNHSRNCMIYNSVKCQIVILEY